MFLLAAGALTTTSAGITATNATFTDSVTAVASSYISPYDGDGRLVYALNGDINAYDVEGATTFTPPQSTDASVIGDAVDIVSGSRLEYPYVSSGGDLYVTWIEGSEQRLYERQTGKNKTPALKKKGTRLGVGVWPTDSLSGNLIFSADKNEQEILGIDSSGSYEAIARAGNGVGAIGGTADIDGDGSRELVFLDGSQELRYLEQDGTTQLIPNGSVGSNQGPGFGAPADFGRGKIEIPCIDGSNNPFLIDYQGNKEVLSSSGVAAKTPPAAVDIDADYANELVFIGSDNGDVRYIDDVGGANVLRRKFSRGAVLPDGKLGLAAGVGL